MSLNPKPELPWRPSRDEIRALVQRGIERGLLSVRKDARDPNNPKLYVAPAKRPQPERTAP